ncbi:MAG TPA: restriction endonuclease, partial [Planctomycetota bacterium]|nr:restriction endonuclease [Planctomycetota bacterium]
MGLGRGLKVATWVVALAALLRVAFDPVGRRVLRFAAPAVVAAVVVGATVRRLRLGRASLAQIDAMSGAGFEDYVAERVRRAGWRVEGPHRRGDFGADLTAERDGVRVAVQAKRRGRSVGNRAVQEASAGADFHRCDAALVVTQAGFTEAALRQAA